MPRLGKLDRLLEKLRVRYPGKTPMAVMDKGHLVIEIRDTRTGKVVKRFK